jgi:prepilin-type N-terminal cleavage/methylation domain-containing protein
MSKESNIKGFTLIECLIALVLVVTGFAAVLSLLTACLKTEVISRDLGRVNSFSRSKIEELKSSARTPGGSLTSNVSGYFDTPTDDYTRRWEISADSMGTETVTVVVSPTIKGAVMPEVRLTTRMY